MSNLFDQKFIVGLLGLVAIMSLVFTGKTDAASAVDYIKWFAGAYILATGAQVAAQKIALGNATNASPENHARLAAALKEKE